MTKIIELSVRAKANNASSFQFRTDADATGPPDDPLIFKIE